MPNNKNTEKGAREPSHEMRHDGPPGLSKKKKEEPKRLPTLKEAETAAGELGDLLVTAVSWTEANDLIIARRILVEPSAILLIYQHHHGEIPKPAHVQRWMEFFKANKHYTRNSDIELDLSIFREDVFQKVHSAYKENPQNREKQQSGGRDEETPGDGIGIGHSVGGDTPPKADGGTLAQTKAVPSKEVGRRAGSEDGSVAMDVDSAENEGGDPLVDGRGGDQDDELYHDIDTYGEPDDGDEVVDELETKEEGGGGPDPQINVERVPTYNEARARDRGETMEPDGEWEDEVIGGAVEEPQSPYAGQDEKKKRKMPASPEQKRPTQRRKIQAPGQAARNVLFACHPCSVRKRKCSFSNRPSTKGKKAGSGSKGGKGERRDEEVVSVEGDEQNALDTGSGAGRGGEGGDGLEGRKGPDVLDGVAGPSSGKGTAQGAGDKGRESQLPSDWETDDDMNAGLREVRHPQGAVKSLLPNVPAKRNVAPDQPQKKRSAKKEGKSSNGEESLRQPKSSNLGRESADGGGSNSKVLEDSSTLRRAPDDSGQERREEREALGGTSTSRPAPPTATSMRLVPPVGDNEDSPRNAPATINQLQDGRQKLDNRILDLEIENRVGKRQVALLWEQVGQLDRSVGGLTTAQRQDRGAFNDQIQNLRGKFESQQSELNITKSLATSLSHHLTTALETQPGTASGLSDGQSLVAQVKDLLGSHLQAVNANFADALKEVSVCQQAQQAAIEALTGTLQQVLSMRGPPSSASGRRTLHNVGTALPSRLQAPQASRATSAPSAMEGPPPNAGDSVPLGDLVRI
ncbi:hypothetical protein NMY22_g15655 [Coprinellus aureogranulatus]|nr:hypothetical protein NMY22_g15655 [Coprinellus aureogranulatus]